MQAWIGNLAAYNDGRLIGEWVEITDDADDMGAVITRICGDVEHYVADYEGIPSSLARQLGEYPSGADLASVARLLDAVAEHFSDDDEIEAVLSAMTDGRTDSIADLADGAADWISDHYAGRAENLRDWCEDYLAETGFFGDIDDGSERASEIVRYFDFESYARDMQCGGAISTERVSGGDVLVFWSR